MRKEQCREGGGDKKGGGDEKGGSDENVKGMGWERRADEKGSGDRNER